MTEPQEQATSLPPLEEKVDVKPPTKEERAIEYDVETPADMVAPMTSARSATTELAIIDRLLTLDTKRFAEAELVFEARCKMIEQCRMTAVKATSPQDWVLTQDKSGDVNAMLCGPGADIVAQYYGIRVFNFRPISSDGIFEPREIRGDDDEIQLTGFCDAKSNFTGQELDSIEGSRSNKEGFVGRGGLPNTSPLVALADLKASVRKLLQTKAVRVLCAMTRVPLAVLDQAWSGTDKKSDQCRKGSGFGSSSERGARGVAESGVAELATALGNEVLSRVGGDTGAAKDLLKEITRDPVQGEDAGSKFKGFDSPSRLTKKWQVEKATAALKSHPTFGDQQQPEQEREPGED